MKKRLLASTLVLSLCMVGYGCAEEKPGGSAKEVEKSKSFELPEEKKITVKKEQNIIPFKTIIVDDYNSLKGESEILQKGENGIETITYKLTLVNLEEKKTEVKREITREVVNEITKVGTKVEP